MASHGSLQSSSKKQMDPIYTSLLLLALGLVVIVLELFVPSAGILGVVAAGLLISSVVMAFYSSVQAGAILLSGIALGLPFLIGLWAKWWPHTPLGKLIMIGRQTEETVLPKTEQYVDYKELKGQLGIAKTKMLPSGIIIVNDRKYDAVSDGFPIEAGQPIKITSVKGTRLYVQPYDGKLDDEGQVPARDRDILSQSLEELGIDEDPLG